MGEPDNQEPCPESGEPTDTVLSQEERRKIFGAKLRALREEIGQTERDIIHLTRISPPFVKALEEGDFERLPGEVFGRGFIKNICQVLETDPKELLQEYINNFERVDISKLLNVRAKPLTLTTAYFNILCEFISSHKLKNVQTKTTIRYRAGG